MSELLKNEINIYWTKRAEGYSKVNKEELQGSQKEDWSREIIKQIHDQFPSRSFNEISVLDVGTGPGFFAVILAEAGFKVTAIDGAEAMLMEAEKNAGKLKDKIKFIHMDAENLEFLKESFDVVISRNLTWVLEKPERAYESWNYVLKKDGLLLNFDANWYGYLFDNEKRKQYEKDRYNVEENGLEDHYTCTDIDSMERIAMKVPLSRIVRPEWDVELLEKLKMKDIEVDLNMGEKVWSQVEKVNYASTPMFMVKAVKR